MAKLDQHVSARPDGTESRSAVPAESRSPELCPTEPRLEAVGDLLIRTFNALRDELVSTLLFVLGNRDDAQDAAQDVFVKCWGARDQLHQVHNLRAWIFRVGFNTAKDMQRSAWNRRSRNLRGEEFLMLDHEPAPVQTLEFKESLERLRKAILGLREEEKEVFLLRQNGDLTYEQIAEIRRCPVGTVKTQMRSALEKLRRVLVV
ncbi:MAG: RNA polymerase sigma factor [Gemmataceae bacterium]|nr:RNA polymerase sigma factor [Gemmataceae bacterium]